MATNSTAPNSSPAAGNEAQAQTGPLPPRGGAERTTMSTAIIQVPTETIQKREAARGFLLTQAQQLTINNETKYREAGELAMAIAELRKAITNDFADAKAAAFKAHKAICAQEAKHLDALKEPDRIVRQKLGAYAAEQDRKRQDAEREAIAAARVKAEEEVIQRASDAYERGERSLAERILNGPVIPEAPQPVAIAKPQAAGVAMVPKTQFVVTDPEMVPRQFCSPDDKKIRAHVNAYGPTATIPGVRVWSESRARIGGRIAEPKPVASETVITADEVFG